MMLEDDRNRGKNRQCFGKEEVFPTKQWLNVIHLFTSKLNELFLNDCD